MLENKRVCIVSPDIIGPVKNGGIGTHCTNTAALYVNNGADVSILYTGPTKGIDISEHIAFYKQQGVTLLLLTEQVDNLYSVDEFLITSLAVFKQLRGQNFDILMFQDWQANGFHTIQAKNTTSYFQKTQIFLTMHSSSEWQLEGMQEWNQSLTRGLKIQYCERYCFTNADHVIYPSRHMKKWLDNHGWIRAKPTSIVPYVYESNAKNTTSNKLDFKKLVFFGRLETRKGLELFLDALEIACRDGKQFNEVTFLGKPAHVNGKYALDFINTRFKQNDVFKGVKLNLQTDLDSHAAVEFLNQYGGIIVMPSLLDNLPFAVIESIQNNLPFITSTAGGMPEIVDKRILFEPTKQSLAKKLKFIDQIPFSDIKHTYNLAEAKKQNTALLLDNSTVYSASKSTEPLVSICVAYYNYGRYLPYLLKSISANNYENYEVIVVNDGSTEPQSNLVFAELEKSTSEKFKFFNKKNEGIGATRNYAASLAKGEYIVFMDADNAAMPTMLNDFVTAIEFSGADCVTSHFSAFEGKEAPSGDVAYNYMPIGACLELGILENVFGDANFIIKKRVFDALGGFETDRHTSWEDYDFLARLCLKGKKLDVVPLPLFWYRHTPEGFSRNTSVYKNHLRILKGYQEDLPPYLSNLIKQLIIPAYYDNRLDINSEFGIGNINNDPVLKSYLQLAMKFARLLGMLFPINSRRRNIINYIINKFYSFKDKK